MAKTLRERFIEGLIRRGNQQVKTTPRYVVFSRADGRYYYVGSSGALRIGKTTKDSIPVSNDFKKWILEEV